MREQQDRDWTYFTVSHNREVTVHTFRPTIEKRRRAASVVACGALATISLTACRGPGFIADLIGRDDALRTPTCAVIAPALMPPDELDADVARAVRAVADLHGSLIAFVARGPSASAFTRVRFDKQAHGGAFGSAAKSSGRRNEDAARWSGAALAQIRSALVYDAPSGNATDGLDLFGGLDTCARELPGGQRARTIFVVSHGVHRTESLDLALDPGAASAAVSEHLATDVPAPAHLVLLGLGRVDAEANTGPAARTVTEPVTKAWTAACASLGPRCTTQLPTNKEANR